MLCGGRGLTAPFPRRHPWMAQCPRCGFLFSAQRPSEEELAEYYSRYPAHAGVSAITLRRFDEFLEGCEPFRKAARLLDYGAGDGFFAERAKARGWRVAVIELSTAKEQACEAKGLQVLRMDELERWTEAFDVVVAHELLEHVRQPAMLLATLVARLREGGLLYLTTPNIAGLSRRILGERWRVIEYPEHLNYFSAKTLRRLLASQPLTIRRMETTGVDPEGLRKGRKDRRPGPFAESGEREALRETWERGSRARLKRVVNAALSLLRLGDTIKAWAVREAGPARAWARPAT